MTTNWSDQQKDIFEWAENSNHSGDCNLVVRARAGTGKTTTILEAINHAPEQRILLCAFNKRIAEELNSRLKNPRAQARTLHSVGFTVVRRNWEGITVDDDRKVRLARAAWGIVMRKLETEAPDTIVYLVARLAGLGKNSFPMVPTSDALIDLAYAHNAVPENGWADQYSVEMIAAMAVQAMNLALRRDGTIDFDDMIFLPVAQKWVRPVYDLIVVDEAQDMNPTQLALAIGLAKGRIAVVGDDKQAIYAFRGADSNAIDRLKAELGANELPLTVTYRCPKLVVAQALPLCPDFVAHETAPEGKVEAMTTPEMEKVAEINDFILSRLNAPLAALCLSFLRAGRPARIEGRDMAKSLVALVRRMKVTTVPEMMDKLTRWQDREVRKLSSTGRMSAQARIDFINDQVETIDALSDGLELTDEVVARINALFGEDAKGPAIILSTVHRAKGLEAPRVFLLADTLYCRGKRINDEERNIHYVGITRAKETLVLVHDEAK